MPKEEKSTEKPLNPELQQLQDLYDLMLEKGLDAVELKEEESRIKLTAIVFVATSAGPGDGIIMRRRKPPAPARLPAKRPAPSNVRPYRRPWRACFTVRRHRPVRLSSKDGDAVEPGQTLCIVEAMKVMNEIKAETRCRIIKIVAENGRPVTAGQPLFQTEPA